MNTEKLLKFAKRLAYDPERRIAIMLSPDHPDKEAIDTLLSETLKRSGRTLDEKVDATRDAINDMLWDIEADQRRYFVDCVLEVYNYDMECEDVEEEDLDFQEVSDLIWDTEGYTIDLDEFYNYACDGADILCWIAPGQQELFDLEGDSLIEREDDEDALWFEPFDTLLKQQGYSSFDHESQLCRSLEEEADNATYPYGLFFVVLAHATLNQLEALSREGSGEFLARRGEATIGLFNPAVGAGSSLEVELEDDWRFTATSGEVVPDGAYGYGVWGTFGTSEYAFRGCEILT